MCNAKACRLLLVDFSPSLGPPGGAEGNLVKFPLFGMNCKSLVSLEVVKIGRRLLGSKH
jgi:hypothetical protein